MLSQLLDFSNEAMYGSQGRSLSSRRTEPVDPTQRWADAVAPIQQEEATGDALPETKPEQAKEQPVVGEESAKEEPKTITDRYNETRKQISNISKRINQLKSLGDATLSEFQELKQLQKERKVLRDQFAELEQLLIAEQNRPVGDTPEDKQEQGSPEQTSPITENPQEKESQQQAQETTSPPPDGAGSVETQPQQPIQETAATPQPKRTLRDAIKNRGMVRLSRKSQRKCMPLQTNHRPHRDQKRPSGTILCI